MVTTSRLVVNISANSRRFVEGVGRAKKEVTDFDKGLSTIARKSAIAFAAVAGSVGLTVKRFADFESQFTDVVTLLDDTSFSKLPLQVGIDGLRDGIKSLRTESGESFANLNKGLFDLISAGTPANKAIDSLRVATQLATAGATNTSVAVDGLTSAINAYGLDASEAGNVSAKFFQAQKEGKTTVEELARSFGKTGAIAKTAGISFEELLASVSAITKGGVATSEAFTSLNAFIAGVIKPTKDATAEAERLGIEFNSTALRTKGLQGFLEDLVNSEGFNSTSVEKLFGSVEALKATFSLTGTQAKDFQNILKNLGDQTKINATLQDALATKTDTTAFKTARLTGAIDKATVNIGSNLAPAVNLVLDNLASLIITLTEADSTFIGLATAILGLKTAAIVGSRALSVMGISLTAMTAKSKAATIATRLFGGALRLLPFVGLATAIAGVVGFLRDYVSISSQVKRNTDKVTEASTDLEIKNKDLSVAYKDLELLQNRLTQASSNNRSEISKSLTIKKEQIAQLQKERNERVRNALAIESESRALLGKELEQKRISLQNRRDAGFVVRGDEDNSGLQGRIRDLENQVLKSDKRVANLLLSRFGGREGLQERLAEGIKNLTGVDLFKSSEDTNLGVDANQIRELDNATRSLNNTRKESTVNDGDDGDNQDVVDNSGRIQAIKDQIEVIKAQEQGLSDFLVNNLTERLAAQTAIKEAEKEKDLELREAEILLNQEKLDVLEEQEREFNERIAEAEALSRELNLEIEQTDKENFAQGLLDKEELIKQSLDRQRKLEEQKRKLEIKSMRVFDQKQVSQAKQLADGLVAVAGNKSKKLRVVQEALNLANKQDALSAAVLNIQEGISGATKAGAALTFPKNILAISAGVGAVLSTTSGVLGAIKAARTGGVVGGGGLTGGGDKQPFLLEKGEIIVPQPEADSFKQQFGSLKELQEDLALGQSEVEGGGVVIEIADEASTFIKARQVEADELNTNTTV